MRYLLSLLFLFLFSCSTQSTNTKFYYEKETAADPEKVNIFFIRPLPISLMWFGYTTFIGINDKNVGSIKVNEKGKVTIDEGLAKISTSAKLDPITKLMTGEETFTTRFEKGKNYYFLIESSAFKVFTTRPITYENFAEISHKNETKESFSATLNKVNELIRNQEKFKGPSIFTK